MKKNQNKSKFEERKSRDAEGEPCIHFGGEDYCPEYKAKKITCDNCPKWIAEHKSSAVTVVEPSGGAVGMTEQDVAAGIKRQCKVIEDAEKNAQLERAKLGVILIRWEQYIGEARGRGKTGEGLKGWLEENVPELNYKTAVNYKSQAEMALKMLGGGAKAQAVLLDEPTVTQPDGEVIEIEADYVEKRDKIFEDVKSRRQLEQTYFKFMASEGRRGPGRPKGSGAAGTPRAKTAEERVAEAETETREILGKLLAFLRGNWLETVSQQTRDDFARTLRDCADQAVRIAD